MNKFVRFFTAGRETESWVNKIHAQIGISNKMASAYDAQLMYVYKDIIDSMFGLWFI